MYGGISEHHKHHHNYYNLKHTATSKRYHGTTDDHHTNIDDDLENLLNESLADDWQVNDHDELVNSDPEADQAPFISDNATRALSRALPHSLY